MLEEYELFSPRRFLSLNRKLEPLQPEVGTQAYFRSEFGNGSQKVDIGCCSVFQLFGSGDQFGPELRAVGAIFDTVLFGEP